MKRRLTAVATGMTLLLAGCGNEGPGSAASAAEPLELYGHTISYDEELAAKVPDDWKDGVTVPIQVLRPNAFVDEAGNTVGLQPDLLRAIGTKLGIDIEMEVTSFDAQVPGVQANRYAFTTATGDFPKRRDILTMVDYTLAGLGWMVLEDSPIKAVEDVCGATIGVAKGTNQEVLAEEFAAECEKKGVEGTKIVGFSNTLMSVPLEARQIDVTYDSVSSVMHFAEEESGKFRMVGDPDIQGAIAWGVNKPEAEKADLLMEATQALVDEGVYTSVFEHWGLPELQLDKIYKNSEGMDPEKYIYVQGR